MSEPTPKALVKIIREVSNTVQSDAAQGAELLGRFVASGDESAFRSLLQLYGPLVWGVCLRVLGQRQDAEDAFQATFLVLARKANRIVPREKLPAWLHGVAFRAARKVREAAGRRREVLVPLPPEPAGVVAGPEPDLRDVIDEELDRLPAKLRQAVVLCHLGGKTYAEAGLALGCATSTIADRLDKAAALLRIRLRRRGLVRAGGLGSILVGSQSPASALTAPVADRLVERILGSAGGPSTAASAAAEGVIRAMSGAWVTRGLACVVLALGVGGGWAVVHPAGPETPPRRAVSPQTEPGEPRSDRLGDPLPAGAVARIGTLRFRTTGHGAQSGLAFLPDGGVVSAHGRDRVVFWDTATGQIRSELAGPAGCDRLDVSPDGKKLVGAGASELRVWDLGAGGPRERWRKATGPGARSSDPLAFTPDGRLLAVADAGIGGIRLLDPATGDQVGELGGLPCGPLVSSADGRVLLAGLSAGDPRANPGAAPVQKWDHLGVWDVRAGGAPRALAVPTDPRAGNGPFVVDYALSPDGKTVAWLGSSRTAHLTDVGTGRDRASWRIEAAVALFAFRDARTLVEFSADGFRLRDSTTGAELVRPPAGPAVWPTALWPAAGTIMQGGIGGKRLSADGSRFALAESGRVAVWDVTSGRAAGPAGQLWDGPLSLSFSHDGKLLLTQSGLTDTRVWASGTGEPVSQFAPDAALVRGAWLGSDARVALWQTGLRPSALARPQLTQWDGRTGKPLARANLPHAANSFVAIAPGGSALARWSERDVVLAEPAGRELHKLRAALPVRDVKFSDNGQVLLAVHANGGSVEVWDARSGRRLGTRSIRPAERHAPQLALSPEGRFVASVERAGAAPPPEVPPRFRIEVWDVEAGTGRQLPETDLAPTAVAFAPGGRVLALGTRGGAVSVWDAGAGRECQRFTGHTGAIHALTFSPDGRRLASGSADGTGLIWDTASVVTPAR